MTWTCRCELKWRKFGLHYHIPAKFGTTQWQELDKVSVPFLLYRAMAFAFFWGFFIYNLIQDYTTTTRPYYMIYLTNWTYLAAILDIAVQLASAVLAAYRCHKGIKPLIPDWLYKIHWITVNISHTMEPLVTAMYWAGVFPFLDIPVTYSDIHLHLLTTLYTLLDLTIHGTPRRFHHVIHPLGFGISYLLFSVIYYACGGLDSHGRTAIYPILDWARPGLSAGVAVAACVVVLLMHGLTWGVVRLRLHLHGRWRQRRVSTSGTAAAVHRGGGADSGLELRVDVDVGDGGVGDTAQRPDAASPRQVGVGKAFDNAALVMAADGDNHCRSVHSDDTNMA